MYENFTQIVVIEKAVGDGHVIIPSNKKGNPAATIRKAESVGFFPKLCTTMNEFERWYSIHLQRAADIGIRPLQRRLIERIWRDLGKQGRSFLQLVMAGDEIAAGSLFILHRDVCDVFAISMDSRYAQDSPNYVVFKAALLEMSRRGVKFMNWQSSPKRGDGVFKFKRQWGSEERLYSFVTKTYCDEAAILSLGADGARREYPDHFLVPFGVFAQGRLSGKFAKA